MLKILLLVALPLFLLCHALGSGARS